MSQPTLSYSDSAATPNTPARPQPLVVKAVTLDHVPARHMAEAVGYRPYIDEGVSLLPIGDTVYEKFNVAMRAAREYAKANGHRVVATPTIPVNNKGRPAGGAHRRR